MNDATTNLYPDLSDRAIERLATIPAHLRDGLQRYITQGVMPGDFLTRVICNDLVGAVGRADHVSIRALPELAAWLYNYAPAASWGSRERFEAWTALKDHRSFDECVRTPSTFRS